MELIFREWPKIKRLKTDVVTVTEKIDGTNACVVVADGKLVGAQSRSRLITPNDDNFGFAAWAADCADILVTALGDGYHYGEWAGPGIQKNRHLLSQKTFFLFNAGRWSDEMFSLQTLRAVPKLYEGEYSAGMADRLLNALIDARPYRPEGVIIYWHDTGAMAKKTLDHVDGKWAAQ